MMTEPDNVKPMHAEKWGFWVKIKDQASANYAIKMSGLPIFLLGINFALAGFMILLTFGALGDIAILQKLMLFSMLPLGLALIVCGLLLRKNVNRIAPITAIFYIAISVFSIVTLPVNQEVWLRIWLGISVLFSVLFIMISLGGLRGWLWLRRDQD